MITKSFSRLSNAGRIKLVNDPYKNLKQIGLIKERKVTFAASLLFGNHNTNIHIGRFKTEDIIIDDILIKSPLIIAVDEAMTFINKSILLKYDFNGDLRRKETWQYPLSVIRELLLNSVIHKDYRNPTDIILKVFDNKIIFTNPGKLLGDLKPENLLSGDYLAIHRNKLLAEVFYLRGDIEKFGTGYYRMRNEIAEFPEIDLSIESDGSFTKSSLIYTTQETTQEIILRLLAENPKYTRRDLIKLTGKSDSTIKEHLAKLKRDGLIKRIGSTKSGYWEVT